MMFQDVCKRALCIVGRCWGLYYEYEVEFGGWQELYSDTMQAAQAAADPRAALEENAALAKRTLPLLTVRPSSC
jgi:hypothetical protein